jgi:hypothetical protein
MDCSDGAKMLIDQMKEHPEEFRGFAGKFTSMLDTAREAMQGPHRNVKISQRDARAVIAAAETHLYEVWLAEDVLTAIMNPKEEEQSMKATFAHRAVGKSVLGTLTGANIASNTISNTTWGPSYEDHMREMERYKMEMAKQEEFKRRELEHAMRSTKSFKGFI